MSVPFLAILIGLVPGALFAEAPDPAPEECPPANATRPGTSSPCLEPPPSVPLDSRLITQRYPDGTLKSEMPVDDFGLFHGLGREYHPSGALKAEHTYRHGTLHGPSRLYYPEGILKTEWHYRNGLRQGLSVGYYRDGTIKDKGLYENDQLQGRVLLYFSSGKIKAEMNFKDNLLEGPSKTYYEGGGIKNLLLYDQGRLLKMETYGKQGERLRVQEFPR